VTRRSRSPLPHRSSTAQIEAAGDCKVILGLCALDMIARLNPGRVVEALQAAAVCDLVVSTLAMGVGNARLLRGA
jgi:hypothetical protein